MRVQVLKHFARANYCRILRLQETLLSKHRSVDISNCDSVVGTIVTVEHNPVYTLGRREIEDAALIESLNKIGAPVIKVKRGGLITFHGPGQLVCYPVLNLRYIKVGVKNYVCALEKAVVDVCKSFGVSSTTAEDTGVWVNDSKICAIGIQVSHGVSWHGLALNCSVDLSWFDHIVPCGLDRKGVTSLSSVLGYEVPPEMVVDRLVACIAQQLNLEPTYQL